MAHFAEIDESNIVVRVINFDDEEKTEEEQLEFLDMLGGKWIQTSYNTRLNIHTMGGTPLRKNYAGIGMTYDENLDAFIAVKPEEFPSFVLNEETGGWEPPVPFPGTQPENPLEASVEYFWDEDNLQWVANPDWIAPE
jgi:hypothetical protein